MTKTKQFGTFMTNCHPVVEELEPSSTNPEMLPISFATGAVDNAEAGPTEEEECLVQKLAHESGQTSYDEATGLPLDAKMVADAIKEELMFMRTLQVYHEVPVHWQPDLQTRNKGVQTRGSAEHKSRENHTL